MKSKSSALQSNAEPSGQEPADLEETVSLPALFLPSGLQDSNDEDASPSPLEQAQVSAQLIELGKSLNENLERIATALEKVTSDLSQQTKKKTAASKPSTTRKKRATSKQQPRKKKTSKSTRAS